MRPGSFVVICGARNWGAFDPIRTAIDESVRDFGPDVCIVHGGAVGADSIAGTIAAGLGLPMRVILADWKRYPQNAGKVRNRVMLDLRPARVYAFKDGLHRELAHGGTEHMIRIARARNVDTRVFSWGRWLDMERADRELIWKAEQ